VTTEKISNRTLINAEAVCITLRRKQNQDTGAVDERETWVSDEIETVGIGSDGKDGYIVIRMKQEGTGTLLYEAMPRRELGSPQGWGRLRSRG
jgi:putative DNA primase/helicase